jgi:recombination protein RecA
MKAAFSKSLFEAEITGRFGPVFQPREKSPAVVIPTGIAAVDELLGGLPRGAITEIYGRSSSGRTTLMLSVLAAVTNHEEVCAWVDNSDCFHPASAATAGARLEQLLWLRCSSKLEHAFKATDLLLQAGGFSLVVLDLGDVPSGDARRIISSWWYRFRRVVEHTPTAFVVLTQDSCVRSCAGLTIEMKRNSEMWSTAVSPLDACTPRTFPAPVIPSGGARSSSEHLARPTHSQLLRGLNLRLERHKPIVLGAHEAKFPAKISP